MSRKSPFPYDKVKAAIESAVDRADQAISLGTKVGVAYVGYNALKHPVGALVGLLGLRLAESNNLAAGAAGISTLTGLGALNLFPPTQPYTGFISPPLADVLARLRDLGWTGGEPVTPESQRYIRITSDVYLSP